MTESPLAVTSAETELTPVDFDPFADPATNTPFGLSAAQQELWAVVQMGPEASCAYNQCFVLRLDGDISVLALKNAVQQVFDRHGALRTRFGLWGETQTVRPPEPIEIPVEDLSALGAEERTARIEAVLAEEVRAPLDLVDGACARVRIVLEGPRALQLVITAHHIVFDGYSSVVFFQELGLLYTAERRGQTAALPLVASFRDHVDLEMSPEGRAVADKALEYWKGKYPDGAPSLELPTDGPRPQVKTYRGAREDLRVTKVSSADVTRVAGRLGATSVGLLLAAFQALLARLSGQRDLVVGLPLSARGSAGDHPLMGHATNLLPLRARMSSQTTFADLVKQAQVSLLDGHDHQDLTFGTLVHALNLPRDPGRTPLVGAILNVDRGRAAPEFAGCQASIATAARHFVNFEVELQLIDTRSDLILELAYDSDLFSAETVRRWLGHFEELLAGALANPDTRVDRLPLLGQAEREAFDAWNRTEADYPRDMPLARLVEEQVARTPEAMAVVYGHSSLTFSQLNARANSLAHVLMAHGIGPDKLVGICLERSADMVVGLLAIVKAGAGYLPLDPLLPPERLSFMIEDSEASLILTQQSLRPSLPTFSGIVVCVDDPAWESRGHGNPCVAVRPDDLAYVIYTSGSTGRPKGVEVPRGALINLLWSMRTWLRFEPQARLLAVTTISFDIAGVDMWLPLLVGARLIVASREDAADGARLRELIDQHRITFLQATPATWRLLLEAGWKGKSDLQIVCTGEAMPRDLAALLAPIVPRLWNLYGPTETTIWSAGYLVRDGQQPILIGRPVANTRCYILDENRQPVPVGVVGELYLGGDGLARGYRRRPELTTEKFLPDPFRSQPGARMYRTGDLARWRPDGNIECLGRTDHQVKIRGFRIELGEIEAVLKQDPRITQAVVIAREDTPGQRRLVGYIVPRNGEAPTRAELRTLLTQHLPDYMVPSDYVVLEKIPISANGKVDRNALPDPEAVQLPPVADEGNRPLTDSEKRVAAILREVLELRDVGAHDDFFDLGGHSLTAVRVIARINQEFNLCLPIRILFEARTCAQLAEQADQRTARVEATAEERWPVLVPVQPNGTRPPLFCVARPNVNAIGYAMLARNLGPDQPVYGLQAELEEDPEIDFTQQQYEDTARTYLAAMRNVQPRGPYYVTGQCQGAYIAFEMARQVEATGEAFGWLGLLDAWTEENTRHRSLFALQLLMHTARALIKRARTKVHEVTGIAQGARNAAEDAATWRPRLVKATSRSRTERLRMRLGKYFPGKNFRPQVVSSRISVFSIANPEFFRVHDPKLGWGNRTTAGVDVWPVPGGHVTILREPHVQVLAQKILQCMASMAAAQTEKLSRSASS